jgi:hypothetical protein
MFLINFLDYMFQLDFMFYIFVSFAFLGVHLLLQRIILGRGGF